MGAAPDGGPHGVSRRPAPWLRAAAVLPAVVVAAFANAHHPGHPGPSLTFGDGPDSTRWFSYRSERGRVDGTILGLPLRAGSTAAVRFSVTFDGERWRGPAFVALRRRGEWHEIVRAAAKPGADGAFSADVSTPDYGDMDLRIVVPSTPAAFSVPLVVPVPWRWVGGGAAAVAALAAFGAWIWRRQGTRGVCA